MSAAVPPQAPSSAGPRWIVGRAKAILLQPKAEWAVIDAEPATVGSIYTSYVLILAAIPAVCFAVGLSVFGLNVPYVGAMHYSVGLALRFAVTQYISALIGVYVLALIIDALAPTFGGQKDQIRALKVAAYSTTASWVVGVLGLVPAFGVLQLLLSLYSLYLLYTGLPVIMKAPADRATGYTAIVILAAIVLFVIIGAVTRSVSGI